MELEHFDVVVAGGGVSGSASAAALADTGLRVLLCEPGLPSDKRLAGELMHPPAAAELVRLGIMEDLERLGGVPSHGFAVFRTSAEEVLLSYGDVPGGRPTGFAIDHPVLTRTLLDHASRRPGVTPWIGARVHSMAPFGGGARVVVEREGEPIAVSASLVVSAEGRASRLREAAGIEVERSESTYLRGWKIPGGRLPRPGFGNVFLGGPATALAYQIAHDEVRIMFEIDDPQTPGLADAHLRALPEPLRTDVATVVAGEPGIQAKVFGLCPTRRVADHLAVVGDAGGCAHPLTASGLSYCLKDARRLAEAVSQASDTRAALSAYDRACSLASRNRGILAEGLVDALYGRGPDMELLREGLFRYWRTSPRGRGRSMGLLSTQDTSLGSLVHQYAWVSAHALSTLGTSRRGQIRPALMGLARRNAEHLRVLGLDTVREVGESLRARLRA